MMRTGRDGKFCAETAIAAQAHTTSAARSRKLLYIILLSLSFYERRRLFRLPDQPVRFEPVTGRTTNIVIARRHRARCGDPGNPQIHAIGESCSCYASGLRLV